MAAEFPFLVQPGSSFSVSSTNHCGGMPTHFCVFLPKRRTFMVLTCTDSGAQTFVVHKNRRTIHVVDDDAGIRDSTQLLLESFGFRVQTFSCAADYLESGLVGVADCALFDVHMPGMTGLELLELLRSRDVETPVIVMTANGEHIVERMIEAGASSLLRKPFDESELVGQIDAATAQSGP
ncbi:MAG: response regulator transcription factor [Rhizomicrobium sp.]